MLRVIFAWAMSQAPGLREQQAPRAVGHLLCKSQTAHYCFIALGVIAAASSQTLQSVPKTAMRRPVSRSKDTLNLLHDFPQEGRCDCQTA